MNFWDKRYQLNAEAYGHSPNPHLKKFLSSLDLKGKRVLFPGEGQGRNSSFAYSLGVDVTCFDSSEVAQSQSQILYDSKGQDITYELAGYETFDSNMSFDVICLVYCHCDPDIQKVFFKKMVSLLKDNGLLYILGYTKKQLVMNSGGPKKIEMLYPEDLEKLISLSLVNKSIFSDNVYEGKFHQGKSHLIELVFKNETTN